MFSETDKRMMTLALEEARAAGEAGEIPVGAVVARGDRVIARAHNLREAPPDPTGHAEVIAIRRAARAAGSRRLTGMTLYVTLEPCPMCAGAIIMAGLDRLVFGAYDPLRGCAGSVYRITEDPAFAHFCPADGGLMADKCAQTLNRFMDELRGENHSRR